MIRTRRDLSTSKYTVLIRATKLPCAVLAWRGPREKKLMFSVRRYCTGYDLFSPIDCKYINTIIKCRINN